MAAALSQKIKGSSSGSWNARGSSADRLVMRAWQAQARFAFKEYSCRNGVGLLRADARNSRARECADQLKLAGVFGACTDPDRG